MKHYLTRKELEKILLGMKENEEIEIYSESEFDEKCGSYNIVLFRMVFFHGYKVFLYDYPSTNDVGLIQEDETYGWDTINDVYDDFNACGLRLFVND